MKNINFNDEFFDKMRKQHRKNKIRWIIGIIVMLIISILSYNALSSIGETLNLEFASGIIYSWYVFVMVYTVETLIKRQDFNEKFKIISETSELKEIIENEIISCKTEIHVVVSKNEE